MSKAVTASKKKTEQSEMEASGADVKRKSDNGVKKKADHSGHRDRLRNKYVENGVESLAQHEVLEMLLYNAIPYRNTNDVAKNLIDHFGSLSAVFDASREALTENGLTRN